MFILVWRLLLFLKQDNICFGALLDCRSASTATCTRMPMVLNNGQAIRHMCLLGFLFSWTELSFNLLFLRFSFPRTLTSPRQCNFTKTDQVLSLWLFVSAKIICSTITSCSKNASYSAYSHMTWMWNVIWPQKYPPPQSKQKKAPSNLLLPWSSATQIFTASLRLLGCCL